MLATTVCAPLHSQNETESDPIKFKVAGNRKVSYLVHPAEASDWENVFSNGVFYSRLRQNTFAYHWEKEAEGKRKDNYAQGIGGSLIFRSAPLHGCSFTAGVYTSHSPLIQMDREDIGLLKSGKDVLARRSVKLDDNYNLTVLGQAFLEYENETIDLIAGRQLYESLYTASNDTKMIPNTFDGISSAFKTTAKSTLRVAWFTEQKLRDHATAHDVITFRDAAGDSWANQDDAGIHKGLTYAAFVAAGESVEHDIWIADYQNSEFDKIPFKISGYAVPGVVQGLGFESSSKLAIGRWTITPGVRFMFQMDDGGGKIGGAAISGSVNGANPSGYTDPQNLDSGLWAVRFVLNPPKDGIEGMIGYSKISDEADFVAPWRSFPTGGYTRAMGQYNWRANNQTTMFQIKLNLAKVAGLNGMNSTLRYAIQDEDETKGYADRRVLHIDITKKLQGRWENTEIKVRYALVDDDGDTGYAEYRFETNILF